MKQLNEKPAKRVIALTGGIGTGKSFVAKILQQKGIEVFDCDRSAKKLMRENEEVKIDYEEDVEIRQEKTPWIGDLHHFSKVNCHFRDLTITRLVGKDTIHLDEVIVVNHDNVIIMRKMFGNTKIILPVDVELSLQVNTLYGELRLFSQKPRKLRNETVSMETPDYRSSHRTVKLVVAGIVGDVEVVRG